MADFEKFENKIHSFDELKSYYSKLPENVQSDHITIQNLMKLTYKVFSIIPEKLVHNHWEKCLEYDGRNFIYIKNPTVNMWIKLFDVCSEYDLGFILNEIDLDNVPDKILLLLPIEPLLNNAKKHYNTIIKIFDLHKKIYNNIKSIQNIMSN